MQDKRSNFPRFYYLSNDEVLEILVNANSIALVDQHLRQSFEILRSLTMEDARFVAGVESIDGEQLHFAKRFILKLENEDWLSQVEQSMRETMQKLIKKAKAEYENKELHE